MNEDKKGEHKYIKSLKNAISVLNCFTKINPDLSGSEIARMTGMHKTTAHRILWTLLSEGFVSRDARTDRYSIGPAIYYMGNLYSDNTDITKAAQPVVKALNDITGETVAVSILEEANVILILKEDSRYELRLQRHIGSSIPAHSTSTGKALLSELDEEELDRRIPQEELKTLTKRTIKTKTELKAELGKISKSGVSFGKEESTEGAEGTASIIRDSSGAAVAAMTISIPVVRLNDVIRDRVATLIKLGCKLVSYRLGYRDEKSQVQDVQHLYSWWLHNMKRETG